MCAGICASVRVVSPTEPDNVAAIGPAAPVDVKVPETGSDPAAEPPVGESQAQQEEEEASAAGVCPGC